MKFQFIQEQSARFLVEKMCRVFKVSRSGYYAWTTRLPSPRQIENEQLTMSIRRIFIQSRKTYGAYRIHLDLMDEGKSCGKNRVAALMQRSGLCAKARRKYRNTTDSHHHLPLAPDLVKRDFSATEANQLWTSDITYIWTAEGWLYLAIILDVFSRKIVGWAMKERMRKDLILDAIIQAMGRRHHQPGTIFHSDRGSQYASHAVRNLLKQRGFQQSMGKTGSCYDNAITETFFHSLKTELIHGESIETRQQAQQMIFDYIEVFYNRERRHSAIGYLAPAVFEAAQQLQAA